MSKFKASSSSWGLRQTNGRFGWGQRYAEFTVGEQEVEVVRAYIRNQEEHHKTVSYRVELKMPLREHGIDFDERDL